MEITRVGEIGCPFWCSIRQINEFGWNEPLPASSVFNLNLESSLFAAASDHSKPNTKPIAPIKYRAGTECPNFN